MPNLPDSKIREYAEKYGALYTLDPALVYAVILTESSGNPEAVNPSDPSAGLMQCQAAIGRAYGHLVGTDYEVLELLKLPDNCLTAGCGFILHISHIFSGKFPVAEWIQAYNVGIHGFSEGRRNGAYGASISKYMAKFHAVT